MNAGQIVNAISTDAGELVNLRNAIIRSAVGDGASVQALGAAIAGDGASPQLLGQAIAGDGASVQALGAAIAGDGASPQALGAAIAADAGSVQALGGAIAADGPSVQALGPAIAADAGSVQALGGAIAANGPSVQALGQSISRNGAISQGIVQAGVAAAGGLGALAAHAPIAAVDDFNSFKLVSIQGMKADGPVAKEITVADLFRRDPLLRDGGNTRDLGAFLHIFTANDMRQMYMQIGSVDTPHLRYAMSAYIESPAGNPGPLANGVLADGPAKQNAGPLDRANLAKFSSGFTWSKEANPWRTPDNFIDFRRLKLKSGYVATNRNNAVDTTNDVYVYYFNKVGATSMNDAQLEIPFDTSNFMLPSKWKVYARYPDGVLLYKSPQGVMQAEFPLGTFFKSSSASPVSPFEAAAQAAVQAEIVRINGLALSVEETQSAIQFAAYLGIMQQVKNTSRIRGGGYHMTRHRRSRMSAKKNKKMTKSMKGRGRGRARAASMLKSAKQRYYRTGGGVLGLGSSGPQPLQRNSQLVSQASPV
jgi:hypothetical protein